jgi:hypothetical protein
MRSGPVRHRHRGPCLRSGRGRGGSRLRGRRLPSWLGRRLSGRRDCGRAGRPGHGAAGAPEQPSVAAPFVITAAATTSAATARAASGRCITCCGSRYISGRSWPVTVIFSILWLDFEHPGILPSGSRARRSVSGPPRRAGAGRTRSLVLRPPGRRTPLPGALSVPVPSSARSAEMPAPWSRRALRYSRARSGRARAPAW